MRIAIGSGKGGTGKTTLTVALALTAEGPVQVLDCDVEAPNAHLFIRPELEAAQSVTLLTPQVNEVACTGCGQCSQMCQFNAIVVLSNRLCLRNPSSAQERDINSSGEDDEAGDISCIVDAAGRSQMKKGPLEARGISQTEPVVMVFPELCHGCGGCRMVCPEEAIEEVPYPIGTVQKGRAGDIDFVHGTLSVGRAMSPPVIRAVKNQAREEGLVLLDCPPGTACPFMATVKGADAVILVTEPTAFGLHDLCLAVESLGELNLPLGVVVNRMHDTRNNITTYCETQEIPVLLQIPEQRAIAEAYSQGQSLLDADPGLRAALQGVLETVQGWVTEGGVV